MIAIIDYGVGNLFSLASSLKSLGLETKVTRDAAAIRAADHIILPGVGAFADAMAKLEATGLVPVIKQEVEHKPLLGICLGMQLLFEKSYEYGEHAGLGFIQGEVGPLEPDLADKSLKVPQIGWNALHIVKDDPLFSISARASMYITSTAITARTVPRVHWRPASIPSRSPARYGRARCTAPSSTRKRAATPACAS